jgi:hypothetical protein
MIGRELQAREYVPLGPIAPHVTGAGPVRGDVAKTPSPRPDPILGPGERASVVPTPSAYPVPNQ